MKHVGCIEAVIPQVIHEQLPCRKILCLQRQSGGEKLFHGQMKRGLGQGVFMRSILEVPYGTYCKYKPEIRIKLVHRLYERHPQGRDFFYTKTPPGEFARRNFVAVTHYSTIPFSLMLIYPGRAESHYKSFGLSERAAQLCESLITHSETFLLRGPRKCRGEQPAAPQAVMSEKQPGGPLSCHGRIEQCGYRGGIILNSAWIDTARIAAGPEPRAHLISEATAGEQQLSAPGVEK